MTPFLSSSLIFHFCHNEGKNQLKDFYWSTQMFKLRSKYWLKFFRYKDVIGGQNQPQKGLLTGKLAAVISVVILKNTSVLSRYYSRKIPASFNAGSQFLRWLPALKYRWPISPSWYSQYHYTGKAFHVPSWNQPQRETASEEEKLWPWTPWYRSVARTKTLK